VRSSPGPRSMDLTVTVPAWMGVRVDGTYLDVRIEGTQGDVSVETVRGDVIVRGGTGAISLSSVEGLVDVEKARGKLKASSVNESVRVADSSGDVTIETVNGDITMERMGATSVDAATVNGDIRYVGTMKGTGAYRMSTHNGTVTLAIPQDSDVTVVARTYSGSFSSVYPEKPTETDDGSRRTTKRRTVVLGSGAARAELESFQGSIRISGPMAAPATKKPQ
jgi:DUF4097 and DUF4098 domain-containing protein YvlB